MTTEGPRCVADFIPRRRRGAALEDAICRAAFQELSEAGYGGFTIESVASRAGTGKASIYRRWAGKNELLLDAFCRGIPEPADAFVPGDLDDSVSTRDALLAVVRTMVGGTAGNKSAAMRAMAGEIARDPEFAQIVDRVLLTPRRDGLAALLRRGIGRNDVRADAPIELVAELIPAFFMSRLLYRHVQATDEDIGKLVDEVAMPLLRPLSAASNQRVSEPSGE